VSIVQPLIQPLYGGKSAHEVIATLSEKPERAGYDVVREFWQAKKPVGATRVQRVRQVQRVRPVHLLHPLHLSHKLRPLTPLRSSGGAAS
jgi:hypothetical protein